MRHLGSMTLEYALHSNYVNEIWIVILTFFQCTFYAVFTYVPYRRIVLKIVCLYRNGEYIGKKNTQWLCNTGHASLLWYFRLSSLVELGMYENVMENYGESDIYGEYIILKILKSHHHCRRPLSSSLLLP